MLSGQAFAAKEYDPKELLETADTEIFLRKGYTNDYSEVQGYLNEFLENDLIHQWFVMNGKGTDLLISMFPSTGRVKTSNIRIFTDRFPERSYHVTYSMIRTETIPSKTGGQCWMRYGNMHMKREGTETCVLLVPGDRAYLGIPIGGKLQYEPIADLSQLSQDELVKFDFIRLDGMSYVYANGEFLFKYAEGINGGLVFQGGSELFEGSNLIRCEFDDFVMRRK